MWHKGTLITWRGAAVRFCFGREAVFAVGPEGSSHAGQVEPVPERRGALRGGRDAESRLSRRYQESLTYLVYAYQSNSRLLLKGAGRGVSESLIALYRRKCLLVGIAELHAQPGRGGQGAARVTSAPVAQFAFRLLGLRCPGDRTPFRSTLN